MLTCKPAGNRPFERPRRRWNNNIKMDLEEIGISTTNSVNSTQVRDYWIAL